MQETHRPGLLKQKNKSHKHGRHRSKSEINASTKGKVNVKVISKKCKQQNKTDRRYQASQLRLKKREDAIMKKRQLDGPFAPPLLVAIIPIGFESMSEKLINYILTADANTTGFCSSEDIFHLGVPSMKQRFSFVLPAKGNLYPTLDALKVSDAVVFLLSAKDSPIVDDTAKKLFSIIIAQGLPSASIVLMDLESFSKRERCDIKSQTKKSMSHWFRDEKIICVENKEDTIKLLRRLGNQKRSRLHSRNNRPHLLAENVDVESCTENTNCVTLKLTGYLRGRSLSVNGLIHIPGWGDFQMAQIDAPADPYKNPNTKNQNMQVLQTAHPDKQTSLTSENVPDPMDAEQTWPTHEELQEARQPVREITGITNDNPFWIPEEIEEESDLDESEECEEEDHMDILSEEGSLVVDWQEREEIETDGFSHHPDKYDGTVDPAEEEKTLQVMRAARDEAAFPDEMDTPGDIPARKRFEQYRGLSSFRTSPWDPKENLPPEYARVFQFENFDRTRKRILKNLDDEVDTVLPGQYVTIYVKNVAKRLVEERSIAGVLVAFGLLPHEHKMTVMHFVVKRSAFSTMSNMPIKSKDPVVIHCGFRRFLSRPIYSQHTNGSKHKYERFFQPDSIAVASVYAHIVYPPAPVLMFSENNQSLLATGRTLSADPDRLIIKRVVLSGHPFRVLKHSAIIRFMFFNREDIDWFKPVELRTKFGRRGHIKEPLGTHGHMKAVFDDQLKSQDTVLMPLYKRVYPPWSYHVQVPKSPNFYKMLSITEIEDMEC